MTVERGWAPGDMDGKHVRGGHPVLQKTIRGVYKALVGLYETTFDRAPEDGGAQVYAGHEHSDRTDNYGGWPIIRNLAWSMDGGDQTLWTESLTQDWKLVNTGAPNTIQQGPYYTSPGMTETRPLRLDLAVKWNPSGGSDNAEIQAFVVSDVLEVQPSASVQWITLWVKPYVNDLWNNLFLDARRQGTDTGDSLDIYAAYMWETYEDTQPRQPASSLIGGTTGSGVGGVSTVERWFGWLDTDFIAEDDFISGLTLRQAWAWLAGLYEGVTGVTAPGAQSIAIRGHDHSSGAAPVGGSEGGGLAIPRGCICSGGIGEGGNQPMFAAVCGTGGYQSFDAVMGKPRTQLFWAYVSPGLTSAGAVAYAECQLYVFTTAGTANVRIANQTTGTNSAVVVATTSHQWIRITDVPIQPGWNSFDIEGQGITSSRTVRVYGYTISEIGTDDDTYAYPLTQEHSAASGGGL